MLNNEKILAIIPARGGSKGLPKKNIKFLAGKPLIAHTIEKALKSKYLDKVIVSTDDKKIAEISKKYGAQVPFLRPKKYAKDNSPVFETILHAVNWLEKKGEYFDIVVWLEPTSPLRKEGEIDKAIGLFLKNIKRADSLVSLGEVHLEAPHIMKKIKRGYVNPFIEINKAIYTRQQLPKTYFPYGVIYLSKIGAFKKYKTFYQKRTIPYFIERWQNYEIDDIFDFICVEAILRYQLKNKGSQAMR
ncbi:MAG: hypothetical protein A3A08_02660 [Candidatus Nealsonbacteria bacterium RIFCSPLOWO2_01_FULL_41_9]|uniref:Acylneuraminate cytidylyltransferase n=1 Tax=Candidatus Nealsonbacteria bacterium RIFCSPLOWO2_01_FULL_41_9 TaxID=1801671 RepID=A0A1G2EAQ3_9BACT|nr:MAG: hypothetical protein A3A08_02660 [Candidatus Nealsonbacteria bacterium RIFCSPLOWO2_01_FULL_41_9]